MEDTYLDVYLNKPKTLEEKVDKFVIKKRTYQIKQTVFNFQKYISSWLLLRLFIYQKIAGYRVVTVSSDTMDKKAIRNNFYTFFGFSEGKSIRQSFDNLFGLENMDRFEVYNSRDELVELYFGVWYNKTFYGVKSVRLVNSPKKVGYNTNKNINVISTKHSQYSWKN